MAASSRRLSRQVIARRSRPSISVLSPASASVASSKHHLVHGISSRLVFAALCGFSFELLFFPASDFLNRAYVGTFQHPLLQQLGSSVYTSSSKLTVQTTVSLRGDVENI